MKNKKKNLIVRSMPEMNFVRIFVNNRINW